MSDHKDFVPQWQNVAVEVFSKLDGSLVDSFETVVEWDRQIRTCWTLARDRVDLDMTCRGMAPPSHFYVFRAERESASGRKRVETILVLNATPKSFSETMAEQIIRQDAAMRELTNAIRAMIARDVNRG
jgi:hypothetical protein